MSGDLTMIGGTIIEHMKNMEVTMMISSINNERKHAPLPRPKIPRAPILVRSPAGVACAVKSCESSCHLAEIGTLRRRSTLFAGFHGTGNLKTCGINKEQETQI